MALKIDRKELDEFCPRLFRALDNLGLLPRQLWAKPTEFEKYPRQLFGSIQRYGDVEAGFREWESRVLRDTPYRKEEFYPELEALRQWMMEHAAVFSNKVNVQHLRTSLYARVFQYLYPRRVLVNAYCAQHQGNPGALEPEFVARELPGAVAETVQKVQEVFRGEWDTIVADARARLLANTGYYSRVLTGKDKLETVEEPVETEIPEEE
jgi:hypothetical protein